MNLLGATFQDFINGYGIWVIISVLGVAFIVAFIFLILNIYKTKKIKLENKKLYKEELLVVQPKINQEIKNEKIKLKSNEKIKTNTNYSIIYDKANKEWVVKKSDATRASRRCQTEEEALKYIENLSKK